MLHNWLAELEIVPNAIVYDIVFDLADDFLPVGHRDHEYLTYKELPLVIGANGTIAGGTSQYESDILLASSETSLPLVIGADAATSERLPSGDLDANFDGAGVFPTEATSVPLVGDDFSPLTNDQKFQHALEGTFNIPTFLTAIFRPQSKTPFSQEDYKKSFGTEAEKYVWKPPPSSFTRFGVDYDPGVHGKVLHAREVHMPWDSKWWSEVSCRDYEEIVEDGVAASLLEPIAGCDG